MNKHTSSVSLIDGHTEGMTDAEVIKALGNCLNDSPSCTTCWYDKDNLTSIECMSALMQDALDLINRQQAEIERLKLLLAQEEKSTISLTKKIYKEAKSETIKEFAERLKAKRCGGTYPYVLVNVIDNLVKEMTEVKE